MAQYKIKWDEGDGYIVATTESIGDSQVALTTEDYNRGLNREQEITIETTKGPNKESVNILVKQEGMRENFIVDGEQFLAQGVDFYTRKPHNFQQFGQFYLKGNVMFNVLKENY